MCCNPKEFGGCVVGTASLAVYRAERIFIDTRPDGRAPFSRREIETVFSELTPVAITEVLKKRIELAQRDDSTVSRVEWAREHFFDDMGGASDALRRSSAAPADEASVFWVRDFVKRADGSGMARYVSYTGGAAGEPAVGRIGHINGMAVLEKPIEGGGLSVSEYLEQLSDRFCGGHNIHAVYLPTAKVTQEELKSLELPTAEIVRFLSVDSGVLSRETVLLVQEWIDYLDRNKEKKFLQFCHSEGAVHTQNALKIMRDIRPDLLDRLRIIAFSPASFIFDQRFGLQVKNFYKEEDGIITGFSTGYDRAVDGDEAVIQVDHEDGDNAHVFCVGEDYVKAAKSYVDSFLVSGDLH